METATVLIVHIHIESDGLQISCANPGGATISFSLGENAAISDLEDHIQCTCRWECPECLSEGGQILEKNEKLKDLKELVVRNSLQYLKDMYPLVGKILAAMSIHAFDPESVTFNVEWTPQSCPDVCPEEFDTLIWQVCPESVDVRARFVQILGQLVTHAEKCSMSQLKLISFFSPGLRLIKYETCALFVELSRYSATQPVTLMPPPFVYVHANLMTQSVFTMASLDDQYPFDERLLRDLALNDTKPLDLDLQTCKSMSKLLVAMDWCICEDNKSATEAIVSRAKDIPVSREDSLRLLHIQLRLASGLCPVVVKGGLCFDAIALLAETSGYEWQILCAGGSDQTFTAVSNQGFQQLASMENLGHAVCLQTQTESSLHEHTRDAVTLASNSGARGCLIAIIGLADALDSTQLKWLCRRIRQTILPHSVRFLLFEDSYLASSVTSE